MQSEELKLLLIEDNPGDARLLAEALREVAPDRFELIRTANLGEGLAVLGRGLPDVVLVDLSLPDAEGLESVERIAAAAPGTPVVVLTGLDDEDLAVRALQAGAQDYLPKGDLSGRLLLRSIRYAVERVQTLGALVESQERYALALRGANDGIWDWDLRTGEIYFSERWKAMLGFDETLVGTDPAEWFSRVHPDDEPALRSQIQAHLNGLTPHFEHEHRMRHRSGRYLWMLSRGAGIRDARGKMTRMAGSQSDISERKAVEERLRHDALHDELTGLPNRAFFSDLLHRALGRSDRNRTYAFGVLFLDVDRFKVINDSLGHVLGDELLRMIAGRVHLCIRPEDTVARLGGDEFTVLVEDIRDGSDAVRVADRIHRELTAPFNVQGREIFTSASIGIALSNTGYSRPEEMLRDADIAMYRAKSQGRSRSEVFDRDMHVEALRLLQLETDLRRALERGEFRLHYQPVVSLDDRRILGFEALARWDHPRRGLLLPKEFIPLAEETGLIVPIGRWVLDQVCRQLKIWRDRFPGHPGLTMSLNLSGRQWREPDLVAEVRDRCAEYGLDPEGLSLEITESVIMDTMGSVDAMASELRDLKVGLHIDDFGTGYSSLSYLHRFPINTLKVDRSFVEKLQRNGDNLEIVRSIVNLARSLNMDVVAEGVETEEQLSRLRELGCGKGQGFLFFRPLESGVAEALLAREPVV